MSVAAASRIARRFFHLADFGNTLESRITGRIAFSVEWLEQTGARGDVLDIGASQGWFEKILADRDDLRFTGVDVDDRNLRVARQVAPLATFVHASATSLPFDSESFDIALMFEVLEHLPRGGEFEALCEARRVLRENGVLCLSTPLSGLRQNAMDPIWYFGHRHYRKSTIADWIERAGFAVTREHTAGGAWESAAMTLFYPFKVLGAEIPCKKWFDQQRDREFSLDYYGSNNLFVTARKLSR